jgi:hypothetical protein
MTPLKITMKRFFMVTVGVPLLLINEIIGTIVCTIMWIFSPHLSYESLSERVDNINKSILEFFQT